MKSRSLRNSLLSLSLGLGISTSLCAQSGISTPGTPITEPPTAAEIKEGKDKSKAKPEAATQAAPLNDGQIVSILELANQSEIDQAKLAKKMGADKAVKDFAGMMADEHGKVLKDVKAVAKKAKLKSLESEAKSGMGLTHDQAMTRLQALKGREFDKAYMMDQVAMHQELLEMIDSTLLIAVQNAELKSLIQKVRGSIEAHFDKAQAIQNALSSQI
jgi:putative membrane protein